MIQKTNVGLCGHHQGWTGRRGRWGNFPTACQVEIFEMALKNSATILDTHQTRSDLV